VAESVEEETPWAGDEGQNVVGAATFDSVGSAMASATFDSVGSAMASLAVAFVSKVIVWEAYYFKGQCHSSIQ
jgi:hypothetical protein